MLKNRILGLDIIRSTAILLVVYQHIIVYLPSNYNFYNFKIDGVSLFFVLSGYLIGRILINSENINIYKFLIYRWTKTLPSYYFILILILTYYYFTKQDFSAFSINYIFFTQNLFTEHPQFFKEAWSLSIEEWIYIILPFLLLLMEKLRINKLNFYIIIIIFFILFSLIIRILLFEKGVYTNVSEEIRKITIFRFDSIIFGYLGAVLSIHFKNLWIKYRNYLLIISFIGIFCLEIRIIYYPPIFFTLESLFILFSLPYFSNIEKSKIKFLDFTFNYISKISYSIYLINLTFMQIIFIPFLAKYFDFLFPYKIFYSINYLIFTLIFSFFLNLFIEQPFLKLRTKLFK